MTTKSNIVDCAVEVYVPIKRHIAPPLTKNMKSLKYFIQSLILYLDITFEHWHQLHPNPAENNKVKRMVDRKSFDIR